MKIDKLVILSCFLFILTACGNEGTLSPSNIKENYYAADSTATDLESQLKCAFYKRDSSYLLFNDTLRYEPLGKDTNGDMLYYTETVDIGYVMTSNTMPSKYIYQYLTTMNEKQGAVDFIEANLLPHLSVKLRPFSWLLINHIAKYITDDGVSYSYDSDKSYAVGDRCTALAMGGLSNLSDSARAAFTQSVLTGILQNKVSKQTSETLQSFVKYGSALYGTSSSESPATEDENMVLMKTSGFISPYYWGDYPYLGLYPSKDQDLASFVELVLTQTADEVESAYADYPIVIKKYNAMKKIIINLGYIY